MTHNELREAVARALNDHSDRPADELASLVLYVVRDALREPTREMARAFHDTETEDAAVGAPEDTIRAMNERLSRAVWPAMLAASPLGGGDE